MIKNDGNLSVIFLVPEIPAIVAGFNIGLPMNNNKIKARGEEDLKGKVLPSPQGKVPSETRRMRCIEHKESDYNKSVTPLLISPHPTAPSSQPPSPLGKARKETRLRVASNNCMAGM